jgi:hypothetical protein
MVGAGSTVFSVMEKTVSDAKKMVSAPGNKQSKSGMGAGVSDTQYIEDVPHLLWVKIDVA